MSAVLSAPQVCGVILLRRDGAALLQHRDDIPGIYDPGLWVFPGGHREDHETSEQAARREFLEETRYQCGDLQSLGLFRYQRDLTLEFFWARYDEAGIFECCEGQELRFVPREEMDLLPVVSYLGHVWDRALSASQGVPLGDGNAVAHAPCVPRSHSCERPDFAKRCSQECEHGTQECVRHVNVFNEAALQ